jgi:hypothetical protein
LAGRGTRVIVCGLGVLFVFGLRGDLLSR